MAQITQQPLLTHPLLTNPELTNPELTRGSEVSPEDVQKVIMRTAILSAVETLDKLNSKKKCKFAITLELVMPNLLVCNNMMPGCRF